MVGMVNGKATLIGVTSFGVGCAKKPYPGKSLKKVDLLWRFAFLKSFPFFQGFMHESLHKKIGFWEVQMLGRVKTRFPASNLFLY